MSQAVQRTLAARMTIDPEKASKTIEDFLLRKLNEAKAGGILLGLSGGLDSATAAVLAARAVGAENVFAQHLFDRDSQGKFLEYARGLAEKLRIHFEVRDITPLVEKAGACEPAVFGRKGTGGSLHRWVHRLSRHFYSLTHAGHPALSTLKRTGVVRNRFTRAVSRFLRKPVIQGFQTKHIVRRQVLEKEAAERGLLLIGAANRSEWLIGWFVKDGVDDLPIEPLLGLYKSQVYQLARFLDVPSEILAEPPSPDMFQGLSDETMIGCSWEKTDRVLCVLMNGLDKALALAEGVTADEFHRIRTRHELSSAKREGLHDYPSIE